MGIRHIAGRFRRGGSGELSCRQVGPVLQAYMDGYVEQPEAGRLEAHFARCRDCGVEIEVYRQLKQSLRRTGPEVPSAVMDRLRRFATQLGGKA